MTEKIESLKAGICGGLALFLAFGVLTWVNHLLLTPYFSVLARLNIVQIDFTLLISGAIAAISGFLFGITYRYVIHQDDQNTHLQSGVVLAFGLVRGLAQVDMGLNNYWPDLWPLVVLGLESIFLFAIARVQLDLALKAKWIKPFQSR